MYFRTLSGAFTTTYTIDANVTNGIEFYINTDMCNKNGLKWTDNHPKSGGAIIKETLSYFLKFTFFYVMDFNGQECEITITPSLLSLFNLL